MSSPVVSSRTPVGQIVSGDGTATFAFLKWMQNIGTTVNGAFDSSGAYQGAIGDQATIDGRETLASIVQNISTDGVVQGPGIDFALPYLNKDTDHIADGTGSPLAGGKAAYIALVASHPVSGQTIRFNGTAWLPVAIAVSKVLATSQWLRSYDAVTGTFTASQPNFSDLAGTLDPSQLPADIAYTDQPNVFTTNQTITGNLSVSGNISAANFPPAQVYPASGIAVSTGSAWAASINPADVPRLSATNTFTADQTVTGNLTASGTLTAGHIGNFYTKTAGVKCDVNIGEDPSIASNGFMAVEFEPNVGTGSFGIGRIHALKAGTGWGEIHLAEFGGNVQVGNPSTTGTTTIYGTFTVTGGAKTFRVPHPLDETKDLYHACLEGPENGVFYRGRAKTDAMGSVTIFLPDYFEALTWLEDRSVLLTVINDGSDKFPILKSSEVSAGGFSVRSSIPGTEFYWEVKAVRRIGVERLQVAQDKA